LTPNPIRTVLSSIRKHQVQSLLMGGQACVLYGAAEFSRDTDLAVLADMANLGRLQQALDELQAEVIAVPHFEPRWLDLGLAVHFRCRSADAAGMRIDVMSRMRGVDDFSHLWQRRTTLEVDGLTIDILSLGDLVKAKKTQRAKDWPMIARLVEANYFAHAAAPTAAQLEFWFEEVRTPHLLLALADKYPRECELLVARRPLLDLALARDEANLRTALHLEEEREREADRIYWGPLKRELEEMRHQTRRGE
jgi:hypothetical protein